jgi:hypothetical protein
LPNYGDSKLSKLPHSKKLLECKFADAPAKMHIQSTCSSIVIRKHSCERPEYLITFLPQREDKVCAGVLRSIGG